MLNQALIIARKEMVEALRDRRSLISALAYALMGPAVVGMVVLAQGSNPKAQDVLIGMMSVFTLVAAFVGGMSVAMDVVAGERERRSLAPLLSLPVARSAIATGKWLAVSLFAIAGLFVNLLGFAVIAGPRVLWLAIALFPLALLAASIQFWTSTVCLSIKEAQTYLSLLVFLPMFAGFALVFFPAVRGAWSELVPLLGQQLLIERLMRGQDVVLRALASGSTTACAAALFLSAAAGRLGRDEILYGD
jgi:sodium transport system permease protein